MAAMDLMRLHHFLFQLVHQEQLARILGIHRELKKKTIVLLI
jgi:hypothetical protein